MIGDNCVVTDVSSHLWGLVGIMVDQDREGYWVRFDCEEITIGRPEQYLFYNEIELV